jgi:hypothetical protein
VRDCRFAVVVALVAVGCRSAPERSAKAGKTSSSADVSEDTAAARDAWSRSEVIKRLSEAGLVVTDSGRTVRRAHIDGDGQLLVVSGSPLEIYLFPTAAARRDATRSLDTTTAALPTLDRPRYIASGNLFAVLVTPKDQLAERVELSLTARHTSGP